MIWAGLRTRAGRALTGVLALLAALGFAWARGRSDANSTRQARDAKDYSEERGQIDDEISGIGGTDADRIRMLDGIAGRRGARKD